MLMSVSRDEPAASEAVLHASARSRLKRAMDIMGASALLLFFAPLMAICWFAVTLETPGGGFFRQRRTGLNRRPFRIMKFRTMSVAEDGDQVVQAKKGDNRVTKVGAILRRTSLDELPQLINVLRGEMSLVGPRPHALAHDEEFAGLVPEYWGRFRVRPGLTGLAQVRGFRGEIRSHEQLVMRVRSDNLYVETWSVWLDIKIFVRTVLVVFFQKEAY